MKAKIKKLVRSLPSVTSMLEHDDVKDWLNDLPRQTIISAIQTVIDAIRQDILDGKVTELVDVDELIYRAEIDLLERAKPNIRRVINATGIVLHTGLGRAPLSDIAMEAITQGCFGYCNLEFDLNNGQRGRRADHVASLLTEITGAQAATVVNNNAAATLLILQTLASGREVIVSRGQLVEIGGSFRLPEILTASGAILREVGTTNRTHLQDYQRAIADQTALLLRVHPSNYRVVGFTTEVSMADLATLAHQFDLLSVDDLGSGALFDLSEFGLPKEPCVKESLAAGADLVCFSGDKLLGGPQCGIILGRQDLITQLENNPLMRTYRVDKMTLLALEATLRVYLDPEDARLQIPTLSMLTASTEDLATTANAIAQQLEAALPNEKFIVCSDVNFAGGGAMPAQELPTVVVQWRPSACSTDQMVRHLRDAETPIIVRVRDDAICFDARTIDENDFEELIVAVSGAVWDQDNIDDDESEGISLPVVE